VSALLDELLAAHGGADRWREVTAITAHGTSGGLHGYNDRVKRTTTAEEKKAVANCKEMPTGTKAQRRARAKCLNNARY
jgi:hypothetical protein